MKRNSQLIIAFLIGFGSAYAVLPRNMPSIKQEFVEKLYWTKFFYESQNAFNDSKSSEMLLSQLAQGSWTEVCVFVPGHTYTKADLSGYTMKFGPPASNEDNVALLFKDSKQKTAWFVDQGDGYSQLKNKTGECFDRTVKLVKISEMEKNGRHRRYYLR